MAEILEDKLPTYDSTVGIFPRRAKTTMAESQGNVMDNWQGYEAATDYRLVW